MITIRLKLPLRFDHFEIPAGTTIAVPADIARIAIARGIAEPAEREKAVVEPQETRMNIGVRLPEHAAGRMKASRGRGTRGTDQPADRQNE